MAGSLSKVDNPSMLDDAFPPSYRIAPIPGFFDLSYAFRCEGENGSPALY
jgi:hypothetical protein